MKGLLTGLRGSRLAGGVLRAAAVSGGLRDGDISGLTTFEALPCFDEGAAAFAGCWAQAAWWHGRCPSLREVYAILDGTGREDVQLLAGAALSAATAVVPMLERCFPAIRKFGVQSYRRSSITHGDVLEALGLNEATAGTGLSMSDRVVRRDRSP